MKIKVFTSVLITGLLLSTACTDEFLDKAPDEEIDLEKVFSERSYADGFLSSAYFNLPSMADAVESPDRNPFTGGSDEMEITFTAAYANLINTGAWSATDAWPAAPDIWGFMYEGIRKTNLFLENVDKVPMNDNDRDKWKGEATFLRAFYHWLLARNYGAIPIVDNSIGTDEDYSSIERDPIDEVIQFIADECDKAAELLPWNVSPEQIGRVTRPAALALKAHVLLYMASPLFNGNSDYANLVNHDGTRLFPDYDPQRWKTAADAAKACIDQVEANGYGLYYADDNDPVKNYQEIFLKHNNKEVLFAKNLGIHQHYERQGNPLSAGGYSNFCPTQEMVDAYEMINGEKPITGYSASGAPIINPSSGYTESGYAPVAHPNGYYQSGVSNMYVDRDPRFYASINFSGAIWKSQPLEFWYDGRDGRRSANRDYNISGYLQKKAITPTTNIHEGRYSANSWIYFRLAEQYLNYAEALNEAEGPVGDVHHYVNAIRQRAGMPDLPTGLSQTEMRERIRHERRIELAFEAHRFFDVRRWKTAAESQAKPVHGLNIQAGADPQDDAFYTRVKIENRVFVAPKHYLWPIMISEIEKCPLLVQNPGW